MPDDQIIWYEDGSSSDGDCIPGALCDDSAAGRSWPEHPQFDQGPSFLEFAFFVLIIWLAIGAVLMAGWTLLKDADLW